MLDKLKELREYEGLTQREVAEKIHVDRSTYAGWENGKDIIPLKRLNDLANFYHTSLDYLIGNSPTKEQVEEIQNINQEEFSKNFKEFRLEKNLTQKKLAKKINMSQPNVHKYESQKSLITTNYALEFSKQYQYSLDKLVGRKKTTKK